MQEACQPVRRLYIECQVATHIIRYTIAVALRIVRQIYSQTIIIVFARRNGRWSACSVVEVARETLSLRKLVGKYSLDLMRTVILRRKPVPIINWRYHMSLILTKERT